MATVPQYVDQLLRRQRIVGDQLGISLFGVGRELYVVDASLITLVAVVMKAMTEKGVITDAEWITRLNNALDGTWPDWIAGQRDPDAIP
jgi:hypothetical protein